MIPAYFAIDGGAYYGPGGFIGLVLVFLLAALLRRTGTPSRDGYMDDEKQRKWDENRRQLDSWIDANKATRVDPVKAKLDCQLDKSHRDLKYINTEKGYFFGGWLAGTKDLLASCGATTITSSGIITLTPEACAKYYWIRRTDDASLGKSYDLSSDDDLALSLVFNVCVILPDDCYAGGKRLGREGRIRRALLERVEKKQKQTASSSRPTTATNDDLPI